MRLDKLWIKEFKNLRDFDIDFDEEQMTTVLIGHNGTGKSNLIEAIVIIFRDLDLGRRPAFSYNLTYFCRGWKIQIKADPEKKTNRTVITVDGERISFTKFTKQPERIYLPKYVFAYYSGTSNRLGMLFDKHEERFRGRLLRYTDKPLRPLFYARNFHSQYVLLSFFSFEDKKSNEFLEEKLGISGLESVLFILKKPTWPSKEGDRRFWNARGVVQGFLSELYNHSLAPIYHEERLYLFIPSQERLKKLAKIYGDNREFFKVLESIYINELIHATCIKVRMKGLDGSITFEELSEGEQQLLTVLGLMKFTQDEESLFLLDEPDTHLNPAWKLNYLNVLERVVGELETSHVIMCTHEPLTIGGLLKSQVRIFAKNPQTGKITTETPEIDPRGMGVAALLTSELFGLSTTLDLETQEKLDRKRAIYLKSLETELTVDENEEMRELPGHVYQVVVLNGRKALFRRLERREYI